MGKNIWSKLSKEESINSCTDEQVEYPYYLLTQVRPEYTNACRDFDREKLRTLEDAKKILLVIVKKYLTLRVIAKRMTLLSALKISRS